MVYAIVLLPGHWQIRSQQISVPDAPSLDAILDSVGPSNLPTAISFINTAEQNTPLGRLGHVGVLIQWADGRSFLIDSGMNKAEARDFGKPLEWLGAEPIDAFGAVEEQMGAALQGIRGIGFTHLHVDHTAGIGRICGAMRSAATIYQTPSQNTLHNLHTRDGQARIAESACSTSLLDDRQVSAVPGFDGLYAISAGGHTPGSTVFITRSGRKTWIFAGDLTNTMADINHNRGKGFIYSYLLIPENEALLQEWRLWLRAQGSRPDVNVLVAHDIEAYRASSLQAWPPRAAAAAQQH